MPSCQLISQSGGVLLVSGNLWSGQRLQPIGGIQIKLAKAAPGNVYVGVTSGGEAVTITSGGSLSSGGLLDGFELAPGDAFFINKSEFAASGIEAIKINVPAASSGAVLFWKPI